MPAAEERLTLLEVKMEQVGATLVRMEAILVGLDQRVLGIDVKIATLDQKVTGLDEKFNRLEHHMGYLENRFDKYFLWLVGIQMTILITIAAGLFGIVTKLI